MKPFFKAVLHHINLFREFYLFQPLLALFFVAALFAVRCLTGRSVQESPEALVAPLYNVITIVLGITLAGVTQHHLIGFRACQAGARLRDDIFDALCTLALLSLFLHFLFH